MICAVVADAEPGPMIEASGTPSGSWCSSVESMQTFESNCVKGCKVTTYRSWLLAGELECVEKGRSLAQELQDLWSRGNRLKVSKL